MIRTSSVFCKRSSPSFTASITSSTICSAGFNGKGIPQNRRQAETLLRRAERILQLLSFATSSDKLWRSPLPALRGQRYIISGDKSIYNQDLGASPFSAPPPCPKNQSRCPEVCRGWRRTLAARGGGAWTQVFRAPCRVLRVFRS